MRSVVLERVHAIAEFFVVKVRGGRGDRILTISPRIGNARVLPRANGFLGKDFPLDRHHLVVFIH